MSDKEENNESLDQNSNANQQEQESTQGDNEEEYLEDFKVELEEMYESRVNFMNSVNQIKNRHINLTLILTQFFSRYSVKQIIVFLAAAAVLVVVQALVRSSSHLTLFIGVVMTVLMIAFAVVTFKNILSALTDIRRIKRGFCCIGYQIVKKKDKDDESAGDVPPNPIIAYKDYANMIRTLRFPEEKFKKYYLLPVLMLFLDYGSPCKVTVFEDMPKNISYEYKAQTFTQDWKELKYTLIPAAMMLLYAMSMYLSYAAYTTLYQ